MPVRWPIFRFFVDDSGRSLKLKADGASRPVTYRLPEDHVRWLEARAAAAQTSLNQIVRGMVADLCTWFGLPFEMARLVEVNRQAMKLDRRCYLQHLLVKRFLEIQDEGILPDAKRETTEAMERLRAEREGSQGTPFALRLATEHLAWIQEQADMYGVSAAGYVRMMVEDFANWFSVPPTIAARIAHDQEYRGTEFREYMQLLLIRRHEQLRERGEMYEAYSFRYPRSSEYTREPRTKK